MQTQYQYLDNYVVKEIYRQMAFAASEAFTKTCLQHGAGQVKKEDAKLIDEWLRIKKEIDEVQRYAATHSTGNIESQSYQPEEAGEWVLLSTWIPQKNNELRALEAKMREAMPRLFKAVKVVFEETPQQ